MSEIFLIHGFGKKVNGQLAKASDVNDTFGENIKKEWLETKKGYVFDWGIDLILSNNFSPFITKKEMEDLYFAEKAICQDKLFIANLHTKIIQEKPKILLGHSMGCYIILCYLNYCHQKNLSVSKSIKKIIFTQADIPFDYDFKSLKENIKRPDLLVANVFMPYDNALRYSQIINNYTPAGVKAMLDNEVKNIKFIHNLDGLLAHLKKQEFNLHETVLNNPDYFNILANEIILWKIPQNLN